MRDKLRDSIRQNLWALQWPLTPNRWLKRKGIGWHNMDWPMSRLVRTLLHFVYMLNEMADLTFNDEPLPSFLEARIRVLEMREEVRERARVKQLNAAYDSLPEPTEIDPLNDQLPSTENLPDLNGLTDDPWLVWKMGRCSREAYLDRCKQHGWIPGIPQEFQEDPYAAYVAGMIDKDEWDALCEERGWPETGPIPHELEDDDDEYGWED